MSRAFDLQPPYARLDDADDPVGDLVLKVENVLQRSVKFVRPEMSPGLSFDKLSRDAQARAGSPHTPLKHVAHAEITADLAHIDRLALVDKARVAGDHE